MVRLSDIINEDDLLKKDKEGKDSSSELDPGAKDKARLSDIIKGDNLSKLIEEHSRKDKEGGNITLLREVYEELGQVINQDKPDTQGQFPPQKDRSVSQTAKDADATTSELSDIPATDASDDDIEEVDKSGIENLYDRMYSYVEEVIFSIKEGGDFSLQEAFQIAEEIVDSSDAQNTLFHKAVYTEDEPDTDILHSSVISHSVNVAIYSLRLGKGLSYDYDRDELIQLVVAGLLHDVGMVKVEDIIRKEGKPTQDEMAEIRRHPQYGCEILEKFGPDYSWLAEAALQEHERHGGQGYPDHLAGEEISEYARIIAVADTYEAMTHTRPHRKGLMSFDAVTQIVQREKGQFEREVVKALIMKLSAFPIGCYVRLNSKAVGRVIETRDESPLKPVVRLLYNPQGKPLKEEKEIDLRDMSMLSVSEAIHERDLPKNIRGRR